MVLSSMNSPSPCPPQHISYVQSHLPQPILGLQSNIQIRQTSIKPNVDDVRASILASLDRHMTDFTSKLNHMANQLREFHEQQRQHRLQYRCKWHLLDKTTKVVETKIASEFALELELESESESESESDPDFHISDVANHSRLLQVTALEPPLYGAIAPSTEIFDVNGQSWSPLQVWFDLPLRPLHLFSSNFIGVCAHNQRTELPVEAKIPYSIFFLAGNDSLIPLLIRRGNSDFPYVNNTLFEFYVKLGFTAFARQLFDSGGGANYDAIDWAQGLYDILPSNSLTISTTIQLQGLRHLDQP
ncbi:uncharacterized protein LOC133313117 [Gastrolobium bilobum]|uniref:uncharacterized protein LOC133313117 n=1 Tax=Gastrolobium bilobum TaxID=150636 RepID=UPI002AB18CDA|nr:uncharacterized protein LOC133313117 [Gastrolobium bilobum]